MSPAHNPSTSSEATVRDNNQPDRVRKDSERQPREDDEPQNVSIQDRLSHFTWAWFEVTMSTGAIAVLLGQQPYKFHGLRTIGKIFFILDIVLFLLFCAIMIVRFTSKPVSLSKSLHHPVESFFFGTFWVSIALILYNAQQYGVPECGAWLVKALEVCFWLYAGLALLVVIFQYHVIFDCEKLPVKDAMPAWIFPAYPFLVLGPLAGELLYNQPPQAALNILIGGIVFQGLGWMLALFMYTIFWTRLVNREIPEESKRPGMYVAVGPAAYTSNALIALGVQAPHVLPPGYLSINTINPGDLWKAFAIPTGMFLWLLSFWFFAVTTLSILLSMQRGGKGLHFTLNFWAFIFPNAGMTVAAIYIGNVLGSNGIKAVTSGMTVLLVIAWIMVAVGTVRAVVKKQILWPGKDEDEEDIEGEEESSEEEKED